MRLLAILIFAFVKVIVAAESKPVKEFRLPLAILTASFERSGELVEVFVTYRGAHDGWAISATDDRYVKDTRSLRLDHTYREVYGEWALLSPFEADILNRVCSSFKEQLLLFEKDLKDMNWAKCRYLDVNFPLFLRNFYYLFSAARSSYNVLPKITCISDTLFDPSPVSAKNERRIDYWMKNPEHLMKLRIAAKELSFQIDQWQRSELGNPKRDALKDDSKKFGEALKLFDILYFNLQVK